MNRNPSRGEAIAPVGADLGSSLPAIRDRLCDLGKLPDLSGMPQM